MDEAWDATPWPASNPDRLSEALSINPLLEQVDTAHAGGDFGAGTVATLPQGGPS